MSNIVTFYSYKGGVGRSMAMANIAVLLARRGLRVLAVDWDLEAPGLERYFSYFKTDPSGNGLLNLLMTKYRGGNPNFEEYLWKIEGEIEGQYFDLQLLPSGKEADSGYAASLERFDWATYFAADGGDFIESLREKWRETYDVTLIDSRTGLSDAGGVCTIQLPDIVVAMFTANYQSLYGVRDIMRAAQTARNDLAYERMHLAVVPLPARFTSRTEVHESQEWLGRFAEVLGEFYEDWLPAWLDPRQVVGALKIPQVDLFGFGEKLAVMEQGTSDQDGMGFVYDKVASLLSNDLQDAETVLKIEPSPERQLVSRQTKGASNTDYEYDVYVSYAHHPTLHEWLQGFVSQLRSWVSLEMDADPRFFFDYSEVSLGDRWADRTMSALLRTKLLLAVVTPEYFQSEWCTREWATFEHREQITRTQTPLILPLHLRESKTTPDLPLRRQVFDISDLPLHSSAFTDTRLSLKITERVQRLAKTVVSELRNVPPFDPNWTVVEESRIDNAPFPPLFPSSGER